MPVELRKRKAPAQPPAPAPASKKSSTGGGVKGRVAKAKAAVKEVFGGGEKAEKPAAATADATGSSSSQAVAVGNTIDLAGFGGEVETNDGVKTTLAKLVEESKAGVVLFTYPKASTPGCTSTMFSNGAYTDLTEFMMRRYETSPALPRFLRSPHSNRSLHLRSLYRLTKGQHHLQDQAKSPIPSSLRPQSHTHQSHWSQEESLRHTAWRFRR